MVKKAVTPVIAVILLILMVIAIAGGTFFWVNYIQKDLTQKAGSKTEQATNTDVPFSIVTMVCDYTTDVITATIINNGVDSISGNAIFVISVSDLNGVGLGSNINLTKASFDNIPSQSGTIVYGSVNGLDILPDTEYVVKLISGTSIQTVVCNSQ